MQLDMRQLSSSSGPNNQSENPSLQIVADIANPHREATLSDRSSLNQRTKGSLSRLSFKYKIIFSALAISVIPTLVVGAIATTGYQQLSQVASSDTAQAQAVLKEQRSALYTGTGAVAVMAGAIATLLAYRSMRPLRLATLTTNRVVQQLGRGGQLSAPEKGEDELTVLESNLNLIAVHSLKVRSQQALTVNRTSTASPDSDVVSDEGPSPSLSDAVIQLTETSRLTVQNLSTTAFNQTKSVDTVYRHLTELTHTAQETLSSIHQYIQQGQSVSQAAQVGEQTVAQIKDHHASMWVSLIEAATKVQNLNQPMERLDQLLNHIGNLSANIKLKAMNAALEAARIGEAGEGFANIGEDLHALVRQLDDGITEVDSLLIDLKTDVQTAAAKMTLGQQQASSGKPLMVVAQQQLSQIVLLSQQLEMVSEQALETASQQTQTSTTASQTMVEVATLTSQITEQAALLAESIEQLPTLAQEG
ncbi:MAG: methyl-accepting chemotaxis protein [Cyanobacteria bacterium P01_A01_bin.17]